MRFKVVNEEVLCPEDHVVEVDRADIELLKSRAIQTQRQRIRFCAHKGADDIIQEMFIVHTRDTYVRPHKHLNKGEAFHIIEGQADILFFNDSGKIIDHYELGDYASGKQFYYRISEPVFHSLIINSDIIVFHEITSGPFVPSETLFPDWSPAAENDRKVGEYIKKMKIDLDHFRSQKPISN